MGNNIVKDNASFTALMTLIFSMLSTKWKLTLGNIMASGTPENLHLNLNPLFDSLI